MKKVLLIAMIFLTGSNVFACDICGCSAGNYFIGPLPQFHKHFIGTRYTFRRFESHVAGDQEEFSKDFYQTVELWAGYNIGKKWQLLAFVPYNTNRQQSDDGTRKSSGLGDITAIVNYKVFEKRNGLSHHNRISQQLWIGGGAKLPTGKFAADPDEIIPDANNQPGTGSVDFLLNAIYSYHINDWGLNATANYKINNSADAFRFGNRFGTSAFVFHSFSGAKVSVNPNAGLLYEHLSANKLDNAKVADTGGDALLAAAGAEFAFSKIAVGFNAQLPVHQNLSNGQTTTKVRGMAHLTFLF